MILLPFALFAGMALANGSGQRAFAPHTTKSDNPIPASYDNPFQKYFKSLHTEGLRTYFTVPCLSPDTEECSQEICAMHRAADDRYDCARVFHDYPGLTRIVPDLDKGLRPAKVRAKIRLRFCEPREKYPRKECFQQFCRVVDVRWPDRNLCAHEYMQYRNPASNAEYQSPNINAPPKFRDPNGWMWWESPESARRVGKRSVEDEPAKAVAAAESAEASTVEPAEAAVAEPAAAMPGKTLSHQLTRITNLIKKQEEYVKKLNKQASKNPGNKKLERQLAAAKRRLLRLQARRSRRQRFENSGAARRQRIGEKKEDTKNKRLGVGEHDPKNKKKAKDEDEDEDDKYESDDEVEEKKKKTKTKKTKAKDEGAEEEEVEKKSKSKKTKSPKKTKAEDDEDDEDGDEDDDDDLLEEELEIKENTSKTTKKKSKKKAKANKAQPGKSKSSGKKEKRGGYEFASAR